MARRFSRITYLTLFVVFFVSQSVFGQYTSLSLDNGGKNKKNEAMNVLNSGAGLGDRKSAANQYIEYFFARWTHDSSASELVSFRNKELPDLIASANGQSKTELLDRCKKILSSIASNPKFYPACRYNAMYALGTLNQEEGTPPVPYGPAVPELIKGYQNKSFPDGIRLAALEGLRRHAMLGIADDSIRDTQVVPLLTQIALDTPYHEQPEEDEDNETKHEVFVEQETGLSQTSEPQRSVEIQDWFRMRAIQALGAMKGTKVAVEISQTLLTLIENPLEDAVIKYEAAFALSQLEFKAEDSVELARIAKALVELAVFVCDDSVLFMQEQMRLQQVMSSSGSGATGAGMGGSMGGPAMGGGPGMGGSMGGPAMGGASMPSMGGGMGGSMMSETQMNQINNSIARIKYGFSSISACINGPTYKGNNGTLMLVSEKDQIAKGMLESLQAAITKCVKFLDEGDPVKARQLAAARKAASSAARGGSEMGMGMGMPGGGGMSPGGRNQRGTADKASKPKVNEPKVSMREIEDQLTEVRQMFRVLIDSPAEGVTPASVSAVQ